MGTGTGRLCPWQAATLAAMTGKRKERRCRICRKRPPWRYKNCPPGICKRCYHEHIWAQPHAASRDSPASTDFPLLPLVGHEHPDDEVAINDLPNLFE